MHLEQTAAQSPGALLLEQTAAQSPGAMLQISSQSPGAMLQIFREPERVVREQERSTGKPADSEVQSQVNKDGRIQQKDCAQQQEKEETSFSRRYVSQRKEKTDPHPAERRDLAQFKSVGRSRVQCKREASGVRRAAASDRSVNDIAKQVTMNRERESHQNTKKSSVRK